MNFVEFEEHQTNKMYKLFLTISKQIRDDSYKVQMMKPSDQEFLIKLYVRFKDMLPYMMEKYLETSIDGKPNQMEHITKVLELPHLDKLRDSLIEKVKRNTMTSFPTFNLKGNSSDLDFTEDNNSDDLGSNKFRSTSVSKADVAGALRNTKYGFSRNRNSS